MPEAEITLTLSGKEISLRLISDVAKHLDIALQDIEQTLTGDDPQARWAWAGDADVVASASPNGVAEGTLMDVIRSTKEGLQSAERIDVGRIHWPAAVGPKAQRAIREILRKLEEDLDTIKVRIGDEEPITLEKPVALPKVVQPRRYTEYGSIDGVLDIISAKGALHFSISEHGTKRNVRCNINDDDMLTQAKDALRRRVVVEGIVRVRADGTPISITDVTSIWIRPQEERPIEELMGKLPNLSGGVPAGEYVRRLREGEGEDGE